MADGLRGEAVGRVVGVAGLVEINLPVDGSPRARIRVYICTYSTPRVRHLPLLSLPPAPTFRRPDSNSCHRHRPSSPPRFLLPRATPLALAPRSGKDRLINSAPLVINSTLVGGGGDRGADFGNKTTGALTATLGFAWTLRSDNTHDPERRGAGGTRESRHGRCALFVTHGENVYRDSP